MRVLIWQQFSSNHSSSYTVVGEFQTVEAAKAGAQEIVQFVKEAGTWTIRNDAYNAVLPTPVEQEYARWYGFDGKQHVDWFSYGGLENAIQVWDRLVMIKTDHVDTWQTGHQFGNKDVFSHPTNIL